MKKHHSIRSKKIANIKFANESIHPESKDKLNLVAAELVALARIRLPDQVLGGVLTGQEDEIRQDAIMLAYGWYLRQEQTPVANPDHLWHAPRAIAAALKITKREILKAIARDKHALETYNEGRATTRLHPTLVHSSEWPLFIQHSLFRRAIRQALQSGRISHANAGIALHIMVDLVPVQKLAAQLKVHRSNIYQHLTRVKRVIPEIMDNIEVQFGEMI